MKGATLGAARRYARALVDVALEKGAAETVRRELREVLQLLRDHKDLAGILAHPAISGEKRRAIVATLFKEGQVCDPTRRLLALLVDRGRVALLPDIERVFTSLWNAQRGVVAAEVLSAVPLEEAQTKALESAIAKATGKGVELTAAVEPALLGGLMLKMAGRVYDGTVRAQLRALRARLVTGASHS